MIAALSLPITALAEASVPEVAEIAFEEISIIEGTKGSDVSRWDPETQTEYNEYYHYDYTPKFTVTLTNGTVLESEDRGITYNGEEYRLSYNDGQSYENQWVVGTYTVDCEIWGFETSFDVTITETPVKELNVENITIIEGTYAGKAWGWDDETQSVIDEYYFYSYMPKYTATLKNGTVLESENGSITYNGEEYYLSYYDGQSYKNQWVVGTYTVECSLLGFESSFDVTITENPVKSLEVENVSVIEGAHGYKTKDWDNETQTNTPEYFRYSYTPEFTVTLKNGTVLESEYGHITYNGKDYCLSYNDPQSYENQWGLGTHTVECSLMGFKSSFNVTITENPISKIDFEDISIIEGTHGRKDTHWDGENSYEYFCYYFMPEYTVTLKDGTVLKSELGRITYNDEDYWLSYQVAQYLNPWGVGTHNVECEIMGFKSSFDVTIIESPISEIKFEDISIIEGTHGYKTTNWDGDKSNEYYYYYIMPKYTVTLKDGTVLKSENGWLTYNGENYSLSYTNPQSYENQFKIGTNKVECEIMGVNTSFNVTITETPVKELKAENVSVIEGTHGYYEPYWDGEKYFEYYCYNVTPKYTVTLKDGTVLESKDGWITYNGEAYYISCYSSQSYENQWVIGTYTAECEIMGVKADYEVEIIASPYESIEIIEVKPLEEGIDCWIDYDGKIIYYAPEVIFKLTDKDGETTELSTSDDDIAYLEYNQRENPWTIGGKNPFILHYANLSVDGSAIIKKPSEYAYVEAEDGSGVFIADCRIGGQENLELPSQIDGKTVIGIISLGWNENISEIKSITIPDSVETIIDSAFGGCENLTEIKVSSGNKSFSSENGVLFNKDKTELVAYPVGKTGEYAIPNGITSIVYDAFYNCVNLKSVKIPNSVTEIQEQAFINCTSLTSVTIPKSVKTIGENAFGYTWENEDGKVPNFTINGYSGSAAEEYAKENGFKFVALPKESLINEGGYWYYTVDGEKVNDTTLCFYNNKWYYVEKGVVKDKTTLCFYNNKWYYVEKGIVKDKTTLCFYNDKWYYVEKGIVKDTTTLCLYNGKWYYVEKGIVKDTTTLCFYNNKWYYVEKGVVKDTTTLCLYNGKWYYVERGVVKDTTTLCLYNNKWYYVERGIVKDTTTLCLYNGTWFYVERGIVKDTTTLCLYNGTWFYVERGRINWNAKTLCNYNGSWFYVENGRVNWKATTLCLYNGTWFYVEKGVVKVKTTLCLYNGKWFYVENGRVNWKANTRCLYDGRWYNVRNGVVI